MAQCAAQKQTRLRVPTATFVAPANRVSWIDRPKSATLGTKLLSRITFPGFRSLWTIDGVCGGVWQR